MKSRFLTDSEKRDVARAAQAKHSRVRSAAPLHPWADRRWKVDGSSLWRNLPSLAQLQVQAFASQSLTDRRLPRSGKSR